MEKSRGENQANGWCVNPPYSTGGAYDKRREKEKKAIS